MIFFRRSLWGIIEYSDTLALVFKQVKSLDELGEASLASFPLPFDSLPVAGALLIDIGYI